MVSRLKDLNVLVVATRHNRWAGVEPQQAPLGKSAVLWTVGPAATDPEPDRTLRLPVFGGLTRHIGMRLGHASGRGIDDERGAPAVDYPSTPVEPVVVVATDITPHRERLGAHLAGLVGVDGRLSRVLFDLGDLLGGQQRLVGTVVGSLQRRQRAEVPDSLQVRRAVGQPRWLALGTDRPGQANPDSDQRRQRGDSCNGHPGLPLITQDAPTVVPTASL